MALDKRLNVGVSEYNSLPGFLNIGLEFENEFIIEKNSCRLLKHDATQPFPINSETVEFIYASHLVEHLSIDGFYKFLSECHRMLKLNGVLRIVCPDLKIWANAYLNNDTDFFQRYQKIMIENHGRPWSKINYKYIKSPADYFMCNIHDWHHQWSFDIESISKHLIDFGFSKPINVGYRNSVYNDISNIELEFHKIESLYIEVEKL